MINKNEVKNEERGMDIFRKRVNIKPYEYPEILEYKDAIRHSYWLHTEFNITPDIQDFKIKISEKERNILVKTILSISQVEVNVKRFWGNIYNYFPKPEIDAVGGTFAESEVRHLDAYSFILERLGLNEEFEKIYDIPAILDRSKYLEKILTKSNNRIDIILQIILFSLLIEHISLFGQFYIMMSFNKRKNLFKGLSNIVEATSKEEDIHGNFGIELYKIILRENPEINIEVLKEKVIKLSHQAIEAELKILDWIFADGDIEILSKEEVFNFILNRLNNSLKAIDINHSYKIEDKIVEQTRWFNEELTSTKENDFFVKRSIDYSKKTKQITGDDLF